MQTKPHVEHILTYPMLKNKHFHLEFLKPNIRAETNFNFLKYICQRVNTHIKYLFKVVLHVRMDLSAYLLLTFNKIPLLNVYII